MNEKILKILEFDKMKTLFAPFLVTAQGVYELTKLRPSKDPIKIQREFDQLSDFLAVTQENGELHLLKTSELTEILKRLELDASLLGSEFLIIKKFVSSVIQVQQYFDNAENVSFPTLHQLTDKLANFSKLSTLLSIFDDETGILLDTASDKLYGLRQSIKRNEIQVRKILQALLSKHTSELTETLITIRNDRQVLPVRADSKSKIQGVVHDISSSGQTLYVEPSAAVVHNNAIGQARLEEKNEITRIYITLSKKLHTYIRDLRQSAWALGCIDFIKAKQIYLTRQEATIPKISTDKTIKLLAARHPLIDAQKIVANDIIFDNKANTIVITGPNTGGKTITLKTVGLLTLMAQAGLPIPTARGSQVTIFDEVFADIGDEQSIEESLSTFSSHMISIVEILRCADSHSLVLFDELGAGTDPKEGAALAIAILEALRNRKVKTLATTHYPELKAYGVETENVTNASMIFDIDNMRPTYKFQLGIPGRSSAFEISRRLGLPNEVIDVASGLLSDDEHDVNALIERLEEQAHELNDRLIHTKQLEEKNIKLENSLQRDTAALARERARAIEVAKQEAITITTKAREEAQTILHQLNDKMKLKPHEVIDAMAQLDALIPDLSQNKVLKHAKAQRGLQVGAEIMVKSYGQRGKLVKLENDGKWTVAMGTITTKLAEEEFEVLKSALEPKTKSKHITRSVRSNIKSQLDLRGTRYEEAALEIDNYIDQALLSNLNQITIVHGIGTGVIRDLVQQKLSKNKHVKSFFYAPMNAGGSGATIAVLK